MIVLRAALAALTVAAVVAAAGPTDRAAGRSSRSGPTKCVTDNPRAPNGRWIFPELRSLHARVWSSGLSWSAVASRRPADPRSPNDPAYSWPADVDGAVKAARAAGIEPVLYVNGFPSWSNGGRDTTWAPIDPRDYGDFMAAAVRRYPQVRRWIAFSEPTHFFNFKPQGGRGARAPRIYARLLDAAYGAMHAVRRNVIVVGGNVHPGGANDHESTAPDTFLKYMVLPNGRRPRLDMFGINPYTERPLDMSLRHEPRRVDFNDLDWLIRQLDRYYPRKRLRLFIDEFGWNTEHEALGWLFVLSRKEQAARLTRAYRIAATMPRISTMCWFALYDAPPLFAGGAWHNWTSGLRTAKGARKPAWYAFARVPAGR